MKGRLYYCERKAGTPCVYHFITTKRRKLQEAQSKIHNPKCEIQNVKNQKMFGRHRIKVGQNTQQGALQCWWYYGIASKADHWTKLVEMVETVVSLSFLGVWLARKLQNNVWVQQPKHTARSSAMVVVFQELLRRWSIECSTARRFK